ncbi:MAG: PQQ-dependent sugar dehydrogenase [Mucilaginibacter sp.]
MYDGIQQKAGSIEPVYYWDPVISPGCMMFYTGNIAEWRNNMFIGALSGQHIDRLVIRNNKVVGDERLLADKNERWRCIATGRDGAFTRARTAENSTGSRRNNDIYLDHLKIAPITITSARSLTLIKSRERTLIRLMSTP